MHSQCPGSADRACRQGQRGQRDCGREMALWGTNLGCSELTLVWDRAWELQGCGRLTRCLKTAESSRSKLLPVPRVITVRLHHGLRPPCPRELGQVHSRRC